MNADAMLAFADSLRAYAQWSGRDLNASNLFVHDMLMRMLAAEQERADFEREVDWAA